MKTTKILTKTQKPKHTTIAAPDRHPTETELRNAVTELDSHCRCFPADWSRQKRSRVTMKTGQWALVSHNSKGNKGQENSRIPRD